MNTHESYVLLETAQMLKQAGFDWDTLTYYPIDDEVLNERALVGSNVAFNHNRDDSAYSAPTLDVAQRWLREVKGYYISMMNLPGACDWCIDVNYKNISYYVGEIENYEEAQEAGIKKCLTLLLKEE